MSDNVLLTAADLNLPVKAGFGLWSKGQSVPNGDWPAAEDALVRAAQDWITDPANNPNPTGYRLSRSDVTKRLTLSPNALRGRTMATTPAMAEAAPETAAEPIDQMQDIYPDDVPTPKPEGGDRPDEAEGGDGSPPADPPEVDEEQPEPEPEQPPVEAPRSWSAEDRDAWSKLDPAAQQVVLRRESERDRFVQQKAQEVVTVKQQTEAQARQVLTQYQQQQAQQLEALSKMIMPQAPNPELLTTGQQEHVTLYLQQEAQARAAQGQLQSVHQALQQAREAAASMEQAEAAAQRQQDEAILSERLGTDWTDPSLRQKLLTDLEPIGGELGYSAELMRQADATDILALKRALDWKAKAEKYDALQKAKMVPVRAAKQLPRVMQPGSGGASRAAQQQNDPLKELYPND